MYQLKTLLLSVSLLFGTTLLAQPFNEQVIDSAMFQKLNQLGLHQMVTRWSEYEGTPLTDIQIYDQRGLRIEHRFWNGVHWTRHQQTYDSLTRKTSFTFFDEKDTTLVTSIHRYTYLDSLSYKEETFNLGTELTNTKLTEIKVAKDTMWVMETETFATSSRVEKNLSRYTTKGDSLTVSEFVDFNKAGKMDKVTAYYQLKRKQKNGNFVITSGDYMVDVDVHAMEDMELFKDVITNPDKYVQYQLDGKYPYKYGEEIHSTAIYSPDNLLLSTGNYWSRTTYTYDKLKRIIKSETFNRELGAKEQKTSEQIYHYDSHGLPLKVIETRMDSGKIITYTFEFKK